MHLHFTKVAVKRCYYAHAFQTIVICSSNEFTCNAQYFQTLSGEKWRSFTNSLRGMLNLRSTLHGLAWQFNNLACSSGLMFNQVVSTIAFRSLSSSNWLAKTT